MHTTPNIYFGFLYSGKTTLPMLQSLRHHCVTRPKTFRPYPIPFIRPNLVQTKSRTFPETIKWKENIWDGDVTLWWGWGRAAGRYFRSLDKKLGRCDSQGELWFLIISRFLTVISCFLVGISKFLAVIFKFLTIIYCILKITNGRVRGGP